MTNCNIKEKLNSETTALVMAIPKKMVDYSALNIPLLL